MSDIFGDIGWIQILNLVIAALLGGLIGLERETGHRPAGLRTYMLVSTGSALFTILSIYAFPTEGGPRDTARVAAQVVSGIGFLGAGTVWRSQDAVKGLTTAAGLWVAAAIGMAVGAGFGPLALAATLIVLLILTAMLRFEKFVVRRQKRSDKLS
ncbi:MAG: MgtC/SapB family protein [Anaerolineae bacterium]|jgi:putative Mg2+ transporter-C (MgtC) family protein